MVENQTNLFYNDLSWSNNDQFSMNLEPLPDKRFDLQQM